MQTALLSYFPGMYYYMDPTYVLVIIGAVICMLASANVSRTFNKYSRYHSKRGLTGAQTAEMILRSAGITDVRIEHISGQIIMIHVRRWCDCQIVYMVHHRLPPLEWQRTNVDMSFNIMLVMFRYRYAVPLFRWSILVLNCRGR